MPRPGAIWGFMYAEGKAVPRDYVYASMWFNIFALSSQKLHDFISRDNFAERMTASQIEKAKRLTRTIRKCIQKNYRGGAKTLFT